MDIKAEDAVPDDFDRAVKKIAKKAKDCDQEK